MRGARLLRFTAWVLFSADTSASLPSGPAFLFSSAAGGAGTGAGAGSGAAAAAGAAVAAAAAAVAARARALFRTGTGTGASTSATTAGPAGAGAGAGATAAAAAAVAASVIAAAAAATTAEADARARFGFAARTGAAITAGFSAAAAAAGAATSGCVRAQGRTRSVAQFIEGFWSNHHAARILVIGKSRAVKRSVGIARQTHAVAASPLRRKLDSVFVKRLRVREQAPGTRIGEHLHLSRLRPKFLLLVPFVVVGAGFKHKRVPSERPCCWRED